MPREIVLLTEPIEADDLRRILGRANPDIPITHVATRKELERACAPPNAGKRLLAFCTPVIVPGEILEALDGPAYNFHPGPPTYPGLYPSCFAIYEGAQRFGVTAHVMVAEVDAGPIVGVEWFDIPPDIDRLRLETMSHEAVTRLFARLAPHLATTDEPLPHLPVAWSGRTTRKKDFEALCALPPDVDRDEFVRRYRAVGEGPKHALTITVHGVRFRLDSGHGDGKVYVGGRRVR